MDMDVNYPSSCCSKTRFRGFTLIELLAAIAMATILLGIATPSLSALVQNSRQTGLINHLVSHFNYARTEAIKRRLNVMVCKSQDGIACTTAGNWEEGWILFVDNDNDRQHSTTEALLSIQESLGDDLSITYSAFPSDNYVVYYPTGTSLGNGTFTFCDSRGQDHAKAVVLLKTGRLRLARTMPDGSPLQCDT